MNYAPPDPTRSLHDTWVFVEDRVVHLFYLSPLVADPTHRLIGHAVSRDWLHWEEWPTIELTGGSGSWDGGRVGTGYTFRAGDRYYLAYTGRVDPREEIGLAESDDLVSWRKPIDGPVCPRPKRAPFAGEADDGALLPAWRDPFVFRDDTGSLRALVTARSEDDGGDVRRRGCVATCVLESPEMWRVTDCMAVDSGYPIMEVPEIFHLDGAWWLTFNSGSAWGLDLDTDTRRRSSGTYYLRGEGPGGPWSGPACNLLIGSGEGRRDALVARSVWWGEERLVYHHYDGEIAPGSSRAFGFPKVLTCVSGRPVLRPWPGLEALRTRECRCLQATDRIGSPVLCEGAWHIDVDAAAGTDGAPAVSGGCSRGVAMLPMYAIGADLDVEVSLAVVSGRRAGLVTGCDPRCRSGIFLLFDTVRNEISIGCLSRGPYGVRFDRVLDRVSKPVESGASYRVRVIARDRFTEVYIDSVLLFSTVTGVREDGPLSTGLIVDDAIIACAPIRCHAIEPMRSAHDR